MALFTDRINDYKEDVNPYLEDSQKAFELLREVFAKNHQIKISCDQICDIIDREIVEELSIIHDKKRQLELFRQLTRLKEKASQINRINMLSQRTVLGVGGQFSAGKSCFINSLTNAGLPEDQKRTTSIATYIIHSSHSNNFMINRAGCIIELDDIAIKALTHDFSRYYEIGLASFIENIVICSPDFKYSNIAILDTPGYNGANSGKEEITDRKQSEKQLCTVDYLIWVMDIKDGDLRRSDIDFIKSIMPKKTKFLVVLNKADTCHDIKMIVNKVEESLEEFGDSVYGIIAYNSKKGETLYGGDTLECFIKEVQLYSNRKVSIKEELEQIRCDYMNALDTQMVLFRKSINTLNNVIENTEEPGYIKLLVRERAVCEVLYHQSLESKKKLENDFGRLSNLGIFI